jgi:hypothetical protein
MVTIEPTTEMDVTEPSPFPEASPERNPDQSYLLDVRQPVEVKILTGLLSFHPVIG